MSKESANSKLQQALRLLGEIEKSVSEALGLYGLFGLYGLYGLFGFYLGYLGFMWVTKVLTIIFQKFACALS